ncbi:MAG: hypothetical protein GTN81_04150 [Proteobacteria bacterium]|nr:hypothetical protein [Pseudomonadota bacterium]
MDSQHPDIERRRFERFLVDYPISYVSQNRAEISTGMAVNISEGGLLAYLFDRIGVGEELDLEMFYASELQFTALSAQARIVWKDVIETSEAINYQYGIKFTRMDKKERIKLAKLLASVHSTYPYPTQESILDIKKPI